MHLAVGAQLRLSGREPRRRQLPVRVARYDARLARSNPEMSVEIAEQGGILPLVKLLSVGSAGAQQQAAACLAELALHVWKNRDRIANAGGIEPVIKLHAATIDRARLLAVAHANAPPFWSCLRPSHQLVVGCAASRTERSAQSIQAKSEHDKDRIG